MIASIRRKVAIILESFCKHNPREPDTFLDIAQRLALECKESSGEGATREDFLRLLQNVQDTTHPVYLKVLKICERHPPTGVGGIRILKTIGSAVFTFSLLFHLSLFGCGLSYGVIGVRGKGGWPLTYAFSC